MRLHEVMEILDRLLKRDDLRDILIKLGVTIDQLGRDMEREIEYFLAIGDTSSDVVDADVSANNLGIKNYKSMNKILVDVKLNKTKDVDYTDNSCYFVTTRHCWNDDMYWFHTEDFIHNNWELGVWKYIDKENDKKRDYLEIMDKKYENKLITYNQYNKVLDFQVLRIHNRKNFKSLKEICSSELYKLIIEGE